MDISIKKSNLLSLNVITPSTFQEDFRGKYTEIYNKEIFLKHGLDQKFVQDDYSYSRYNVLRGIHGDQKTWKLISCLMGAFYLVVVDNNKDSKTFKQWEAFSLSEENRLQILVPPQMGNGHYVISSQGAIFHYKQTTYYERESQFTIAWNDPDYGIFWPCKHPFTSSRDQSCLLD